MHYDNMSGENNDFFSHLKLLYHKDKKPKVKGKGACCSIF